MGRIAPGARRTDLSETNNFNNLHCQDAPKAHIGAIMAFNALSKAEAKRHRQAALASPAKGVTSLRWR
jgi:hypothetical protein